MHSPLHQNRPQLPEGQEVVGHSLQEGARCPPQETSGPAKILGANREAIAASTVETTRLYTGRFPCVVWSSFTYTPI